MGLQDRGRRRATPHPCPAKQLALRIRDQRDLLRASGGRNFDRLAGQNSPVWHTLFLFYLVVAKLSQKGKQPHAASYEALEAQVAEYLEACRQRLLGRERPTKYGIPTWMVHVVALIARNCRRDSNPVPARDYPCRSRQQQTKPGCNG